MEALSPDCHLTKRGMFIKTLKMLKENINCPTAVHIGTGTFSEEVAVDKVK